MDKVYIVETTHESGEKERREVEATHIIEAFQKGPYDPYATMVIVKEKVSRDYKAEIAYLTAENERLRGEVEEQKSIAEHEHATQVEWFSIAGDYKAENAELRERLDKAVELPCELGSPLYVIDETRDTDTWELKPCVIHKYYAAEVTVCENGDFLFQVETSTSHKRLRFGEDIFTTRAEAEARLKELLGGER